MRLELLGIKCVYGNLGRAVLVLLQWEHYNRPNGGVMGCYVPVLKDIPWHKTMRLIPVFLSF